MAVVLKYVFVNLEVMASKVRKLYHIFSWFTGPANISNCERLFLAVYATEMNPEVGYFSSASFLHFQA